MQATNRSPASASQKQTTDAPSRAGSIVSIQRSNRVESRPASTSRGLVGLPGAGDQSRIDDFIDPALWEANNARPDPFLYPTGFDSNGFDTTEANTADMSANIYGANQFQNNELSQQYYQGDFQDGLGLKFSSNNEQQYQYDQVITQNYQNGEADHAELDLVQIGSAPNPPPEFVDDYRGFQTWSNNYPMPAHPAGTTPGLSAIPGGSSLPLLSTYPDPSLVYPTGPYHHAPMQYTSDIPIDPLILQQPQGTVSGPNINAGRIESRRSSNKDNNDTAHAKSKRAQPDSDSEDEVPIAKRARRNQRINRSSASQPDDDRRNSTVSDNTSLAKPLKVDVVRAGERPKKSETKSWVRINNTTKGETTRTARINQFTDEGTKYKVKPLPIGDWQTGKFEFEYTQHNGMDEFKKNTMSARQIHEYILQHPGDLRIWIQVTPGDSARRYASKPHSECIFERCPNRQWAEKGTIEVGTYRVAFDEKHKAYGKGVVDPFDCVAYAHLYCVERFLDFSGICQVADVKVDVRGEMPREPKGQAAFTFSGKHVNEKALAEKFVRAAKAGQLAQTPEFSNYPVHTDYKKGDPKPHQDTLTAALFKVNWEHRTRSQLKQFVNRKIKPGSFGVHRGDQEIVMVDKKIESLKVFKKAKAAKQKTHFSHSAYYDQFHPEINIHIAELLALRARYKAEDAAGTGPTRGGKKRKNVVADSDDDEPDFPRHDDNVEEIGEYEQQERVGFSQNLRSSPRNKQRINYADHQDIPQHYAQMAQYEPAYAPGPQHQNRYVDQTQFYPNYPVSVSPKGRKASCTELFLPNDQARYDISQLPQVDGSESPPLTNQQIDEIMALPRRKSSALSIGPYTSIMKSPQLSRNLRSPQMTRSSARTASFNVQPVTSSKEYNINDPPSHVAVSPDICRAMFDHHQHGRRSARLASKSTLSPDTVETCRVDKCRHS